MEPLYPIPEYRRPEPLAPGVVPVVEPLDDAPITVSVGRIASYDVGLGSAPRIVEVGIAPIPEYIETLASQTYTIAKDLGGSIPYTAIRELAENFIHAGFAEPVISILDQGNTIRFADQGPGIEEKEKARLPGFTSATATMKRHIRGVGSGLPIVRDFLHLNGGSLSIEDNVSAGTVVTITTRTPGADGRPTPEPREARAVLARPSLSARQLQALALLLDKGSLGPTDISKETGISVATAHRDLEYLEERGLVETTPDRKRAITQTGFDHLKEQAT